MVVYTNKPEIIKARRAMVEFLLTNHPLDCPVCDKGGECELQELSFHYGPGSSRFMEERRQKEKALPLGPTVIMDEERCVLCRRCARFMEEWTDDPELDLYERGARTVMTTFPGRVLGSHFSGNLTEICPVGALTSRVFRFKARSWEMARTPSVCSACGFGCNTALDTKARRLKRIVARPNPEVNDEWLCDKGRFADGFVHSANRLTQPLVRRDGQLQPASWDEALDLVASRLGELAQTATPDGVGGIGSARATCEANYLLQKVLRASVGTNNVDFVGRPLEGADPLPDLAAIHAADMVLLVGLDPAVDAPLLDLWLRREGLTRKVRVAAIDARRPDSLRRGAWLPCRPGTEVAAINGIIHQLA
jgi:NADH-quinone oxidoreductase subunit G